MCDTAEGLAKAFAHLKENIEINSTYILTSFMDNIVHNCVFWQLELSKRRLIVRVKNKFRPEKKLTDPQMVVS